MSTLNEGKIVINKFVDYLTIEESLTDINLYAIAVFADLKVNGYNLSTERRLQKELTKVLREQEVVSVSYKDGINDITNNFKVKFTGKTFILELILESDKLTLNEFITVLEDKFGWDQAFVKHIKTIMLPDFFDAYFNSNADLNETYAEAWLENYKNKWKY